MRTFSLSLKILAIGIFGVSAIHIVLGVSSEPLLGASLSALSMNDANLDSQNRFYGAAFALFGAMLWLSSTDLLKYRTVLALTLLVFLFAGLARLISIAIVGWPTTPIIALTLIEILGPPVVYIWLKRVAS